MTRRLSRIGRLGLFVAMAGASWLVEACGGNSTRDAQGPGSGGTGGNGGTTSNDTGGSATGGLDIVPGTGGSGGEGGLHDLPCE